MEDIPMLVSGDAGYFRLPMFDGVYEIRRKSSGSAPPTSPYNAKPVPRFEVTTSDKVDHMLVVLKVGEDRPEMRVQAEVIGSCKVYKRARRWFEKGDPLENDIRDAQRKLMHEYILTLRLSGSAETLTGVKLDV